MINNTEYQAICPHCGKKLQISAEGMFLKFTCKFCLKNNVYLPYKLEPVKNKKK